ncbi:MULTISPECIES: hypothetical protein [unclassified Pseudoalteromonas]|uniref:DUF6693 family protein n=1 Tax=unclassified Pseudoalteromonas TaxID=194690 RepID=UPI0005A8A1DF|nr:MULTISPECIES: hypothetical protein [unclassified Pseudoalteromonas]
MKIKKYRLRFDKSLMDLFLPITGWTLLTLVTFGLATPFFIIYIIKITINNTVIEHYNTID